MRVYEAMPDSAFVYTQAVYLGRRLPAVAGDYPQVPNNVPPRAFNLVTHTREGSCLEAI